MRFLSKITVVMLVILMLTSLTAFLPIMAEAPKESIVVFNDVGEELPDNDILLEGYLEKQIYERAGASFFGISAGDYLDDEFEKACYDAVKPEIIKIAGGERTNTEIEVLFDDGIDVLKNEISGKLFNIIQSLLADMPFEMFWYGKDTDSGACSIQYGIADNDPYYTVYKITFKFAVARDYRKNASDVYTLNPSVINAVNKAIDKAEQIVEDNEDKSDYEKLVAYKNEICELTSYNHIAAGGDVSYGNPWQMIWVFDGDLNTNVVCEGYAKAFKYLCDMSNFNSEVYCYTVNGYLNGNPANGHMWNVLEINGRNYIADITNIDEGSIGYNHEEFLFLNGIKSVDPEGISYNFKINALNSISYTYSAVEENMHGEGYLVLSENSYIEDAALIKTLTVTGGAGTGTYIIGDTVTIKADAPAKNQKFDKWQIVSGTLEVSADDLEKSELTFVIPNSDISIKAIYHTHDFSADEYGSDGTYHWKLCATCGDAETSKVKHSFSLDVDEQYHREKCECGYVKSGSEVAHSYSGYESDGNNHWQECSCGHIKSGSTAAHNHTISGKDAGYHWKECVCSHIDASTKKAHGYTQKTDENKHWQECECGNIKSGSESNHNYNVFKSDNNNHWQECSCGRVKSGSTAAHEHTVLGKDASRHWMECACGHIDITTKAAHSYTQKANADNHWQECECGNIKSFSKAEHSFTTKTDDSKHWQECECGYIKSGSELKHSFTTQGSDEDGHWMECECGKKTEESVHHLSVGFYSIKHNENEHWSECDDCGYIMKIEKHEYKGNETKPATAEEKGEMTYTCEFCNRSYTESIPKLSDTPKPTEKETDQQNDTSSPKETGEQGKTETPIGGSIGGSSCTGTTPAMAVLILTSAVVGFALTKKKEE